MARRGTPVTGGSTPLVVQLYLHGLVTGRRCRSPRVRRLRERWVAKESGEVRRTKLRSSGAYVTISYPKPKHPLSAANKARVGLVMPIPIGRRQRNSGKPACRT